jgi:Rrf2 family transcriptional regulator, cysteine metabolism repressor
MLKLSTKGRYASRALLELALRKSSEPVLLREIAKSQEMSEKYLERIMSALVSAGFVQSLRGQHGGFILARQPSEITLSQVLAAAEGPLNPVPCVGNPKACSRSAGCATRDVWTRLKESVASVLDSVTLEDLVRMHRDKQHAPGKAMYYI